MGIGLYALMMDDEDDEVQRIEHDCALLTAGDHPSFTSARLSLLSLIKKTGHDQLDLLTLCTVTVDLYTP